MINFNVNTKLNIAKNITLKAVNITLKAIR